MEARPLKLRLLVVSNKETHLFVVAVEGLVGQVHKAEESECLKGFPISRNLTVSHLRFVDDMLLLCDGGEKNLWCIKAILRSFERVSGSKTNYAKSNMMGINIKERDVREALIFLACWIGKIPLKFLGVPVGANPRRYKTWEPVVKAMKMRLSMWKSKQLSVGGE